MMLYGSRLVYHEAILAIALGPSYDPFQLLQAIVA